MHYLSRVALAGAALLSSSAATAQEQQPDRPPSDIVVTGNRNVEREAREFVNALTPAPPRGQLARFESAICPAALGMSGTQRAAVERRLRVVADAAGIPVAKPGCSGNAVLILTQNKRAFIEMLLRRHAYFFGDLSLPEIRRLAREPGPVAAWQLQQQVAARGGAVYTGGSGPAANRTTEVPSYITAPARPVFGGAVLVIETEAVEMLSTTQIADYAAMRLFARTDPDRLTNSDAPTIVKILDSSMGSEVPLTLTDWDLGFLRGLYASEKNLYAGAQRSRIRRGITKELQRREGKEPSSAPAAVEPKS
jgi:hypothetical protein